MLSNSSASLAEYRVKSRLSVFMRMMATTEIRNKQSMNEFTMENQCTLCSKNFGSKYRLWRSANDFCVLYHFTEYVKFSGAPSYTGHGFVGSMSISMIWFPFLKNEKCRW